MCSENFPEMYRQTNDWMCLWAWMLIVYVCVELSGRTSLLTLINSSTLLKHPPLFNSIHTFTSNTDTIASGQFDSMFNSGISLFFLLFCSVDSLCTNRLHEPKWIIYSKRSWQPKHTTTFSQKKKKNGAPSTERTLLFYYCYCCMCVCVGDMERRRWRRIHWKVSKEYFWIRTTVAPHYEWNTEIMFVQCGLLCSYTPSHASRSVDANSNFHRKAFTTRFTH